MLCYKAERVLCDEEEFELTDICVVKAIVCNVRLLRRLSFKNEFFVPFVPTKYILFIFPTSNPLDGLTVTKETSGLISMYLKWLENTSKQKFNVLEFLVCTLSGCVVVVIRCADVLSALDVHSSSQDDSAPAINNRCVLSFFCDKDDISDEQLESDYYIIPTCTLCAERLEPTLTGYTSRTCRCFPPEDCACLLEQSSCVVCKTLIKMQLEKKGICCDDCNIMGDPWICLLCGFAGCSRYQAQHARKHFLKCKHFFSMSLLTQQIWDYDGDSFVHRVVVTFDTITGVVHRVQYPDRDNLSSSFPDDMGDLVAENAKKQHINAKYDHSVEMSNEKLALMVKERLDARRVEYESEEQMQQPKVEHTHAHSKELICESDIYRTMCLKRDKSDYRERWFLLAFANKKLEDELQSLANEVEKLEGSQAELDEELRKVVQHYAVEEGNLIHKITEQEQMIKEVEINLSLRKQLTKKLGDDECTRMCVVGGGGATTRSGESRKKQKKSSKSRE